MKHQSNRRISLRHTADFICFSALTVEDRKILTSLGYTTSAFPNTVYSIDCSSLNHVWHGIGIRNINNGVEFIDFTNMDSPCTLHKKGVSVVYSGKKKSRHCCLFSTFLDYLAYICLSRMDYEMYIEDCDYIILNDFNNLGYFLVESEDYDNINMFLPNTWAGKTLAATIMDRNPTAKNWSYKYSIYPDLRSCLYYQNT